MEQGNIDRLLEVLADLGFDSVEEFFDYFPYDRIFNEIWEGRLEANSLTEIAFAAHISAQYAMPSVPGKKPIGLPKNRWKHCVKTEYSMLPTRPEARAITEIPIPTIGSIP